MDEGRNMVLIFPSLVHLKTKEAKEAFKPRCHIFYSQRVVDVPDGLPKWSGKYYYLLVSLYGGVGLMHVYRAQREVGFDRG